MRAALEAPHPETWPEMRELADALARAFGGPPELPRHAGDGRATAALARWSEGYSNAELCEAIRGAALDDHLQAHPQFQTLATILKSPEQVDRFRKLARQGRKTGLARASPRVARDVVTENQERQLRRAAELRAKEEAEKAIKAGFF